MKLNRLLLLLVAGATMIAATEKWLWADGSESQTQGADMKSGKCRKCQSTDVRVGPPSAGARGPMNKFAVSFWKNIVPERHICMSCGYMEQYVADPADRAAIGVELAGPKRGKHGVRHHVPQVTASVSGTRGGRRWTRSEFS